MDFRIDLTVEVDQVGNALAIRTPIPIQAVHHKGRWHVECETPPVRTEPVDSMEEAVVTGAKQVAREVQAAVIERPLVVGKITPETVSEMF